MQPCGVRVNSFCMARGTAPLLGSIFIPAAGQGGAPAAPRALGSPDVPAVLPAPAPAAVGARGDGQECTKSQT